MGKYFVELVIYKKVTNKEITMEKIYFKLPIENDYPPVSEESVWGEEVEKQSFQIKNIPFYTKEVSFNDIVSVIEKDGVFYYKKMIKSSGNSTVRVIFFNDEKIEEYISHIEKMGCDYEKFSSNFLAINIPITTNIEVVLNYLEYLSSKEIADYEYGKITQ